MFNRDCINKNIFRIKLYSYQSRSICIAFILISKKYVYVSFYLFAYGVLSKNRRRRCTALRPTGSKNVIYFIIILYLISYNENVKAHMF